MSRRLSATAPSSVAPITSTGAPGGFVLHVEAPDAGLSSLVELAETLAELARDALPQAVTHTEVHPLGTPAPPSSDGRAVARSATSQSRGQQTASAAADVVADGDPAAPTADSGQAARTARGVEVNMPQHRLIVDGRDARVTHRELELLAYLLANPHRVIGRDEIMRRVWGYALGGPGQRTIDVHIRRLRDHLGRYRDLIATVHGVGYRIVPGGIARLVPDDSAAPAPLDRAVGQ